MDKANNINRLGKPQGEPERGVVQEGIAEALGKGYSRINHEERIAATRAERGLPRKDGLEMFAIKDTPFMEGEKRSGTR